MLRSAVKFNHFGRISKASRENLSRAVRSAAFQVEGHAKSNIVRNGSVVSGNLLGSISTEIAEPLVAYVGTEVHYAPYVEFGTYRNRAKPFLVPALRSVEEWFQRECSQAVRRAG